MNSASKTFVGFGFGPIQSALFLLEASLSGKFSQYVIAEVDPAIIGAIRAAGGKYTVNIAHATHIQQHTIGPIEIYNPKILTDRRELIKAIASADEIATALPSVKFFSAGEKASVTSVLGDGLAARKDVKPVIIYTAENNNHAAEVLESELRAYNANLPWNRIQILNTVIGKMSGVIADVADMQRLNLTPMTPDFPRAVLVEAFNRILISKITIPGVQRGIDVFVEKPDLLPFEEAKLYGHNATHALIGYLAWLAGVPTMADAGKNPQIMAIARKAFIEESGEALVHKYKQLGDPLFTTPGFHAYAEDLLVRMVNPHLNDLVARIIRDPARKLGVEDRLFGTMRVALSQGIQPTHFAQGAAVAVLYFIKTDATCAVLKPASLSEAEFGDIVRMIWSQTGQSSSQTIDDAISQQCITLAWEAFKQIAARKN